MKKLISGLKSDFIHLVIILIVILVSVLLLKTRMVTTGKGLCILGAVVFIASIALPAAFDFFIDKQKQRMRNKNSSECEANPDKYKE